MSTLYKYTITTKKGTNVSTIDADMQRVTSKAQYPFFPTRYASQSLYSKSASAIQTGDNAVFPTFGGHTQSIVVNPYDAPVPLTTQGNLKFSGSIKFTL